MNATAVITQSIAAFALHALWQVPLLAGACWCAVRLGRPQARVAHVLWVATLLLCVALPVGSTVTARRAAFEAERAATATISYESPALASDSQPMERVPAWKRLLHRHLNSRDGLQPFSVAIPQRWATAIAGAWLLVIAFFSAQFCIGWVRVRALVRAAADTALPTDVEAALQEQCARLHLLAPVAKLHDGIAGPVLAGVVHPTLLLPSDSANAMGHAEIRAVLAHELAHLRRRDPLMHAACSLLLVPIGFHPAALWAARCVRQTREMACDAEAAGHMGSSADYAWALLQVAERTSKDSGQAAAAGLFSNGLFGAGLQLFTNRGAMEERMQMLMNNGSKVRGRALRVGAGVSLATAAVVAATMLQVQPTLAAERSLPQSTQQVAVVSTQAMQENEPALLSGEHAREQLRRAQRQLVQAESQATNAEDRKKIEGAQQAIAVAEQALSEADGSPQTHRDHSDVDRLNLQWKNAKLPDTAAIQAQMAAQDEAMHKLQAQMNSPEWKAQMQRLETQTNSPEWKAQMQRLQRQARSSADSARAQMNSLEFKAQMEQARKFDRTKIDAMLADARKQQERAMEQIRSGAIQRQIDAARLIARNELPVPVPAPLVSPSADAVQQDPNRTVKIAPGVMAGNKIGGSNPVYPPAAKEKHIQGAVVLHAIIDKTGHVEAIQVVSSPDDQLSKSAVEAVQTWIYKPFLLNGDPTAVDTTVTVNFSLVQ